MPRKPTRFFSSLRRVVFPKWNLSEAADPRQYIGKTVLAQRELVLPFEEIKIRDIRGCVAQELQKYFQVNGTHLVSMFSFYMQMEEGRLPTQVEENEFNLATDIKDIRKIDGGQEKTT